MRLWPKRERNDRLDYLIIVDGKHVDAYPVIRDAIGICRENANRPHHCDNCPRRGNESASA